MILPIELVAIFAVLGVVAIAIALVWLAQQLLHLARHKTLPVPARELKLQQQLALKQAELDAIQTLLSNEKARHDGLEQQLKETLQELVSRV